MRLRSKKKRDPQDYYQVAKAGFCYALIGVAAALLAVVLLAFSQLHRSSGMAAAGMSAYFFLLGLFPVVFDSQRFPQEEEYRSRGVPDALRRAFQMIVLCGLATAAGLLVEETLVQRIAPALVLFLSFPAVYFMVQGMVRLDPQTGRGQWARLICYGLLAAGSGMLWLLSGSLPPVFQTCAVLGAMLGGLILGWILLVSIRAHE